MGLIYLFTIVWKGRNSSVGVARGWNPSGGEIFHTHPDRPWGPPSFLYNRYRVFPTSKVAGVWRWPLTPNIVPRLRKDYSDNSTPPLGPYCLFWGELYFTIILLSHRGWVSMGPGQQARWNTIWKTSTYLQNVQIGSWAHSSFYSVATRSSFPWCKADPSPPSRAEVRSEWSYTSVPLYTFVLCTGTTTVPLLSYDWLLFSFCSCRSCIWMCVGFKVYQLERPLALEKFIT